MFIIIKSIKIIDKLFKINNLIIVFIVGILIIKLFNELEVISVENPNYNVVNINVVIYIIIL